LNVEELRARARAEEDLDAPDLATPESRAPSAEQFAKFTADLGAAMNKTARAIVSAFDKTWEDVSGERGVAPGVGAQRLFERMQVALAKTASEISYTSYARVARATRDAATIAATTGMTTRDVVAAMRDMSAVLEPADPRDSPLARDVLALIKEEAK
jgi:hypothetical protein